MCPFHGGNGIFVFHRKRHSSEAVRHTSKAGGRKAKLQQKQCENQNPFLISASDGCSTSHVKPEKSARLTPTDSRLCLTLEYNAPTTRSWQSAPTRWSFGRLVGRRKANPARSFMARALTCLHNRLGKASIGLRVICNIREETRNVEKLRATHEKKLHVQKSRTAEVTICRIPERTARSPPNITAFLLQTLQAVLSSEGD